MVCEIQDADTPHRPHESRGTHRLLCSCESWTQLPTDAGELPYATLLCCWSLLLPILVLTLESVHQPWFYKIAQAIQLPLHMGHAKIFLLSYKNFLLFLQFTLDLVGTNYPQNVCYRQSVRRQSDRTENRTDEDRLAQCFQGLSFSASLYSII